MNNSWGKLHKFLAPTGARDKLKIAATREVNRLTQKERDEIADMIASDLEDSPLELWRTLVNDSVNPSGEPDTPTTSYWDIAKRI